ncbi:MAG: anion permease [Hyphomicrobiaceae bacterium]
MPALRKTSLDKDLRKFQRIEEVTRAAGQGLLAPGVAFVFLAVSALLASLQVGAKLDVAVLVIAAVLAGYMALNIGANDVANNVGPAVGARALTMTGALVIAAVFESAGALLAGGDVVRTISKNIIDPSVVPSASEFIVVMMAALSAAAVWVNVATWLGAPVSTTHAVVGGVVGAGLVAVGFDAVSWPVLAAIAASWVISPVMGGVIAAAFLAIIKVNVIYRDDKIAAARAWVPALVAVMASAFTGYLLTKGLSHIFKPPPILIVGLSLGMLVVSYLTLRPLIRRQSEGLENRNQALRLLFRIPLICSAALLSFAHGANDVANAVGPLAGILHASETGEVASKAQIPLWIMLIGAVGISLGLMLFGPRLIRTVGEKITRMNPIRAFCVALSTAITVIAASGLGLPVSSTHIAVGAVFGVGFFREYFTTHSVIRRRYLARKGVDDGETRELREVSPQDLIRRKLVRRSHFTVIVAAWVITVPATAALAAGFYFALRVLA